MLHKYEECLKMKAHPDSVRGGRFAAAAAAPERTRKTGEEQEKKEGDSKMKKVFALLTAAVLALSLTACGKAASSAAADDVIKVGMECAYAPFNYTQTDDANNAAEIDGGGYAGGYDVQVAQKIAAAMGKKLLIEKMEWDGLIPALTSGKIDMIIAGMSPTDERKQSIDFSDNYYVSDLVLVVRKDGKYASATSLADFNGAKVTAQLNTFHYTVVDQIPGVDKQTAMEDFPTMIVALQAGKIDAYVSERPGAMSAAMSNPDLTYIAFDEGKGFDYSTDEGAVAVGVKKGSELTAKINEVLKGISEDDRQSMMETAIKNQPAAN